MVEGTEALCGRFTDYSLKHVRVLHEACKRGIPVDHTLGVVRKVCQSTIVGGDIEAGEAIMTAKM